MFRHLDDLVSVGERGLRELWERGRAPDPDELAGWVFRGWNTSLAAARSPVGGRAFAKGFFQDAGGTHGCNFVASVRDGAWQIDTRRPFGFFAVYPAQESGAWSKHPPALLLDYGHGQSAEFLEAWGVRLPMRLRVVDRMAQPLRDLIVRAPNAVEGLYVGRAFVTSALRLPITCFALERWRPMSSAPAGLDQRALAREGIV